MSLVLSAASWVFCPLLLAIPGVVLGHIAHGQIRRTGEGGDGLALAGLIAGYANIAISILAVLFFIVFAIVAAIGASQQPA